MSASTDAITGKTILITGAAGGIGRALVAAFATAGARRIVAAARRAQPGPSGVVEQRMLDVTDARAATAAATEIGDIDILINNAGVNALARVLDPSAGDAAVREMAVNYFGTLNMIRAVAPGMQRRGSGLIMNVLSAVSHVNMPGMGSYSASKAAALSLTQAVRAELAPHGIRVCALFPSVVDTPMAARLTLPKLSPEEVAAAAIAGIRRGEEDIYLGTAAGLYARWREDPKAVERQMAGMLPRK